MIRSLKFKNFQSFLEETEVLFELPKGAPSRGYERRAADGTRLTTVLAVFGANASGKTAFLKPAAFLLWFMKGSFGLDVDEDIPLPPRILNPNEPSEFEIVFDSKGETWKYELKLTEKRVLWEALYKKATRFSYLFKREWNERNDVYDVQLKSFDLPLHVARRARRNASLVSTARQHDSESSEFIDGYVGQWNVDIDGRPHYLSNLRYANEAFLKLGGVRDQAITLLKSWDLGLDSFEVREEDTVDSAGKKKTKLRSYFRHTREDGEHFTLPEAEIDDAVALLPGLDGRKMSKSYDNTIPLFSSREQLKKLIGSILTDSRAPGEPKEVEGSALFQIYQAFATPEETGALRKQYAEGIAWGDAKQLLFERVDSVIAPMRARYEDLIHNPARIEQTLLAGAERARTLATPFIRELRAAVGLRSLAQDAAPQKAAKAAKASLPSFKQYRERDGQFYFKLVAADGQLLLQSLGFAAPKEAGQNIAQLQREGATALAAIKPRLQTLDGVSDDLVIQALEQLREAAEQ